jgi:hypothetical protein
MLPSIVQLQEVDRRQKNDKLLFGKQQLLAYAILAVELTA